MTAISRPAWFCLLLCAWALGTSLRADLDLGDLLPRWMEIGGLGLALLAAIRLLHEQAPLGKRTLEWTAEDWQVKMMDGCVGVAGLTVAFVDRRPLAVAIGLAAGLWVVGRWRLTTRLVWMVEKLLLMLVVAWGLRFLVDQQALTRTGYGPLPELLAALLQSLGAESGSTPDGFLINSVRAQRGTLLTPELLGLPVVLLAAIGYACTSWPGALGLTGRLSILGRAAAVLMLGICSRVLALVLVFSYLDGQMPYEQVDVPVAPWLDWRMTAALDAIALIAVGVLVARPAVGRPGSERTTKAMPLPGGRVALAAMAGCCLAFPHVADALGRPNAGRILVDEAHSMWEPTDLGLGEDVYGQESGYNFRALVDWLAEGFGPVRRNYEVLEDTALVGTDVLLIKTPTRAYAQNELESILEFVHSGGGLMLIGDHTNVFGTGEVLNQFGAKLGFAFDFDCVFDQRQRFEQVHRRGIQNRQHPILRRVPQIRFEVGCSIDLDSPAWRPLVVGRGLKNLQIDYKATNFYPQICDRADMRCGQLVQMASRSFGQGRVVLLSDSTLLSTFSVMLPGRRELVEASFDWLSRAEIGQAVRSSLVVLGLLLALVCWLGWAHSSAFQLAPFLLIALGTGLGLAGFADRYLYIPRVPIEDLTRERNIAFLSPSATAFWPVEQFVREPERSFDMFYQWTLRIGAYPRLADRVQDAVRDSRICIAIDPAISIGAELDRLLEFVESGGILIAIQSSPNAVVAEIGSRCGLPLNVERPIDVERVETAFGSIDIGGALSGLHSLEGGQILAACEVDGVMQGLMARVPYGRGSVVIGTHGQLLTDFAYGERYDRLPDIRRRRLYELQYSVLRAALSEVANDRG